MLHLTFSAPATAQSQHCFYQTKYGNPTHVRLVTITGQYWGVTGVSSILEVNANFVNLVDVHYNIIRGKYQHSQNV